MKKLVPVLLVIIIGALVFFAFQNKGTKQPGTSSTSTSADGFTFENPKKSAHYETNTPAQAAVLAAVPTNVVIDFNFDLATPSEIKILKDGKDYGVGETVIDANKLAMRRDMDPTAGDGIYTVEYKACWPDGSCHDGSFQFAIKKDKVESFNDMRGKKEVTVSLSDIAFSPKNMRIDQGTKVTWVNDDEVEHYVNTDAHPAHTYHKEQNSKALKKGDSFSLTFDKAGVYPYHCSAHASNMIASIIVE